MGNMHEILLQIYMGFEYNLNTKAPLVVSAIAYNRIRSASNSSRVVISLSPNPKDGTEMSR